MLQALPMQGGTGGGPFAAAARPLLSVTEQGGLAAIRDLALLLLAVPLLIAALSALDRVPRRDVARFGARFPGALREPRTLVSIEARQWLRYPTNAVMLVFTAGLSIGCLTLWRGSLEDDNWLLGAFFLTLISTVGVGSYGPTRPMHWIYHVAGRPLAWVAPKLLSVLAIWLSLLGVYLAVLSLLTSWSPTDGVLLLPMLAVELAAGCVVGLLLPVNRQQSLSGALSECVAILIVLSLTVGLQALPWLQSAGIYLGSCVIVAAGLVYLYVVISRVQVRETRRAGLR